jgi:DNA modification methylase
LVVTNTGNVALEKVVVTDTLSPYIELSEWDENLLADLISEIDLSGFDVELTGFGIDEIDSLMSPKSCVQDDFDEDKAKKSVEENGTITQLGDIWHIGQHRLICGDDVDKLMNGSRAKLTFTTPPPCNDNLDNWLETMKSAVKNIAQHSDTAVVTLGDMIVNKSRFIESTNVHIMVMFADCGFRPLWIRVWDKVKQSELLTAFSSDNDSDSYEESDYNFVTTFANHNYKFTKRLTKQERKLWGVNPIWKLPVIRKNTPTELSWRAIKMHSDKSDIILDVFAGTFTTAHACEQSGRVCYGAEVSEINCDVAVKRFTAAFPDTEIILERNGEWIPFAETGVSVC